MGGRVPLATYSLYEAFAVAYPHTLSFSACEMGN